MDEDRKIREEKVLDTVREWLPDLTPGQPGYVIQIRAADPDHSDTPDGALFSVTRTRAFACRR